MEAQAQAQAQDGVQTSVLDIECQWETETGWEVMSDDADMLLFEEARRRAGVEVRRFIKRSQASFTASYRHHDPYRDPHPAPDDSEKDSNSGSGSDSDSDSVIGRAGEEEVERALVVGCDIARMGRAWTPAVFASVLDHDQRRMAVFCARLSVDGGTSRKSWDWKPVFALPVTRSEMVVSFCPSSPSAFLLNFQSSHADSHSHAYGVHVIVLRCDQVLHPIRPADALGAVPARRIPEPRLRLRLRL